MAVSNNINQKEFGKLKWATLHGHKELIESLLEKNTPADNPHFMEKDFRPPLHSAVYLGDVDIVKKLLNEGASPNVFNKNNETALMLAAKFKKYAIVDLLLSDKRLKNRINKENLTHLHIACMRNRVDVVERLTECKRDINQAVSSTSVRWAGCTALHFAVQSQCIKTVEFLLNAGADITIKNANELTALHLADMIRDEKIIDMILMAHRRVVQNPVNSEGLTHFHIACTRDNPEIVETFMKNGVSPNGRVNASSLNWSKFTAIDFATYYDCVNVVRFLLLVSSRQIFPSRFEFDRVLRAYCTGNIELVNLFLQRDELTKRNTLRIQFLPTLHYSCIYNNIDSIRELVAEAPNKLNEPMWQGSYPLHLAVERGDEAIVRHLLDQGADYNLQNADGKSALHLAFEQNLNGVLTSILSQPERILQNSVDTDGLSYLHISCMAREAAAVVKLIELGVDIDAPVNSDSHFYPGYTPLHFAAKFRSSRVAQTLLEKGASYSAVDKYGLSAFDVAMFECHDPLLGSADTGFGIMRTILSSHSKRKLDSFNDRGFSELHVIDYDGLNNIEAYRQLVSEHQDEINKTIHKLHTRWDGYTPLHMAMLFGDTDHVQLLVEMGADIFREADNGNTPFHLAWNRFMVPEIPLTSDDFARVRHNPVGSQGYSLLHMACAAGNTEWIKYLLDHGVDPNIRTTVDGHEFGNMTPLHVATKSQIVSCKQVVELLLEKGADPKLTDFHLNTPLHSMIGFVEPEIIDLLVSHGTDVNYQNVFGETPLLSICQNYFWFTDDELSKKIELLLSYGADINLADEKLKTPLLSDTWIHGFEDYPSAVEVLCKHVVKLLRMDSYVSDRNTDAYENLTRRGSVQLRSNLVDFSAQCEREIDHIKQAQLTTCTKLYDFMHNKGLNELAVLSGNDEIQRIINSDYIRRKFPIYGYMYEPRLKMQLKKGQERRQLLLNAGKILETLLKTPMPRECLERIEQFLSNEDLQNIIMSQGGRYVKNIKESIDS